MRLTETQFEILKLCYENKDQDILFSNNDFKTRFPKAEYRDSAFLRDENCLEEFGHINSPKYIISKRGEEVYLDNLDRKATQKMQRTNFILTVLTLIAGTISAIAAVIAAIFAFCFR